LGWRVLCRNYFVALAILRKRYVRHAAVLIDRIKQRVKKLFVQRDRDLGFLRGNDSKEEKYRNKRAKELFHNCTQKYVTALDWRDDLLVCLLKKISRKMVTVCSKENFILQFTFRKTVRKRCKDNTS